MSVNKVQLCLTFDIDNDFLFSPTEGAGPLEWRGLKEGLSLCLDQIRRWGELYSLKPAVTLFVRADGQIAFYHGKPAAIFYDVRQLCSQYFEDDLAIDLGWHPHLYKRTHDGWQVEADERIQYEQLMGTYEMLSKEMGSMKISRIGENLFSSAILRGLNECSILADSTAMPGRRIGTTDWRNCPRRPYRPKEDDYNRPGGKGLLEIPMTTLPIKAPYENGTKMRYLNLNFDERFLKDALLRCIEDERLLVTDAHPFEVLASSGLSLRKHLLWGGPDTVFRNLCSITEFCKSRGLAVVSSLLCDVARGIEQCTN
ncbi:MAG: hypothetical protein MUP16_08090 [Sedimentisphaerales bacterium]|nr:hypothetical protein [Sedimentisphaerales bacterium]